MQHLNTLETQKREPPATFHEWSPKPYLRLGSLCTGYGGLDMAAQKVLGATLSWVADNDQYVSKLLVTRFPDIPNLGDLGQVDWRQVDPVDILCAGFPCQDISYAGRGAGIAHCAGDS